MLQFTEDIIERIKISKPFTVAEELVEAGRKGYCSLYQNNPGWVLMKDNLMLPVVKRYLDKICQGEDFTPPPDLPPPPFTGGQCCDVPYRVQIVGTSATSSGRAPYQAVLSPVGAILNIELVTGEPPDDDKVYWRISTLGCDATEVSTEDSIAGSIFADIQVEDITVSRPDGLPDDCGNPPSPEYPVLPLPSPPDLVQDIDVTNNNGDTNTYRVAVNTDIEGTILFSPVISVNNIRVGIDLGGITIGGGDVNSYSYRNPGGGGAGGGEPDLVETEKEELPEEQEEEVEEDVEKLVAILVDVTILPKNAKIVSGRGAPDLIYAGWIEFKKEEHYYPRVFIDFRKQYYPAPDDATGYAITFKKGYSGKITKVMAK